MENHVSFHIVCNHSLLIPVTFCGPILGTEELGQLVLEDSSLPGTQLIPCLTSEVIWHCTVGESRRKGGIWDLGLATTLLVSLRRQKESRNTCITQQPLLTPICPAQAWFKSFPSNFPTIQFCLHCWQNLVPPALGRGCKSKGGRILRRVLRAGSVVATCCSW